MKIVAEKRMTNSLVQNTKEKWGKRRTGKQCWIGDPTKRMLGSPLSKTFHLYQIVVQPPKDRCQAPLDVLHGVEIASLLHVLGGRKPI